MQKVNKRTHKCYENLEGGVALSTWRLGEGSSTECITYKLSLQNGVVRPRRSKPFPSEASTPQKKRTNDRMTGGMQKVCLVELRLYVSVWPDGRLASSGPEQMDL